VVAGPPERAFPDGGSQSVVEDLVSPPGQQRPEALHCTVSPGAPARQSPSRVPAGASPENQNQGSDFEGRHAARTVHTRTVLTRTGCARLRASERRHAGGRHALDSDPGTELGPRVPADLRSRIGCPPVISSP